MIKPLFQIIENLINTAIKRVYSFFISHLFYTIFDLKFKAVGITKTQAKDYAKTLYLDPKQKLTHKEIASRVGVSHNTIGRWVEKEGWDKMRKSLMTTRKKIITDLYDQLEWLNDHIKTRDNKVADSKETNTIISLTNSIKKLETETSIKEIYEVTTGFLEFLKPLDFELHKKLVPLFDAFINQKIG